MWGWGRPKRDLPPVNYTESSEEEDFEDGLDFNRAISREASPTRNSIPQAPLPTREGSPVLLAHPTLNDNVDDLLEELTYKLHDHQQVLEEVDELTDLLKETDTSLGTKDPVGEEVEDFGIVSGQPRADDCQVPDQINQPAGDAIMVNYDQENKEDGKLRTMPGESR